MATGRQTRHPVALALLSLGAALACGDGARGFDCDTPLEAHRFDRVGRCLLPAQPVGCPRESDGGLRCAPFQDFSVGPDGECYLFRDFCRPEQGFREAGVADGCPPALFNTRCAWASWLP